MFWQCRGTFRHEPMAKIGSGEGTLSERGESVHHVDRQLCQQLRERRRSKPQRGFLLAISGCGPHSRRGKQGSSSPQELGLLTCAYRAWAKLRMPIVSAWPPACPRVLGRRRGQVNRDGSGQAGGASGGRQGTGRRRRPRSRTLTNATIHRSFVPCNVQNPKTHRMGKRCLLKLRAALRCGSCSDRE